jgi:C_GCAxxG_C_C family probable redox protein
MEHPMMNNKKIKDFSRRDFLWTLSGLAAAPAVFSQTLIAGQDKPKIPITKLFSPEEWERLKKSVMASEIDGYFGHGYSCAEAMLLVALRRLELDEKTVWASAAYGGGLGQKDLCGFLTGGMMAVGMAAGKMPLERREAKKLCSAVAKEFWEWWKSEYPLRCDCIVIKEEDRAKCRPMGPRVAAKLEELLTRFA